MNALNNNEDTVLHIAARRINFELVTTLCQGGVNVNALSHRLSALFFVVKQDQSAEQFACILQLLCYGAKIFPFALESDRSVLLPDIHNKLKMLQDGKRTETYMSDEEEEFMFNFGFALAIKHPVVAFKVYVVRARSARISILLLTSTRTSPSEVFEHQHTRIL